MVQTVNKMSHARAIRLSIASIVCCMLIGLGLYEWVNGSFRRWNIPLTTGSPNGTKETICYGMPKDIELFNQPAKNITFCCKTCAMVASSGVLAGSKARDEIESNDCIIRLNNGPTVGFESDVGSRTTFRVLAHPSIGPVKGLLKTHKKEINSTIFIEHAPSTKQVKDHLSGFRRLYPNTEMYFFKEERNTKTRAAFNNETGHKFKSSKTWLTCGWFAMLFAREICGKITLFGFVDDKYCEKVYSKKAPDPPYHYYDLKGPRQCAFFRSHQRASQGHQYIVEKQIFRRWSQQFGNIYFKHPEW